VLELHGPKRQFAWFAARAQGQLMHTGGHVGQHPVPPARAGGRIGVIDGDDKTLGARRCVLPANAGRHIAALATKAIGKLGIGKMAIDLAVGLDLELACLRGDGPRQRQSSDALEAERSNFHVATRMK